MPDTQKHSEVKSKAKAKSVREKKGEEEDEKKTKSISCDWLHLSDDEAEDYEVFDHEVTTEDVFSYPEGKTAETTVSLGLKVAPRYYHSREVFPMTEKLIQNFDVILEEVKTLLSTKEWTPWPEETLYSGPLQRGDWKVIPLLYTFPAFDPSKSKWVSSNARQCPKTVELLKEIPGIRTALFSRLGPLTRLSAHQGWADLANYVLRCHLPLIVPENQNNLCGMWVEGHLNYHKERELLVFDDSKWHKAFNGTSEDRVVLIFDIMRPENLPKGQASAGHTDKLDEFIAAFEMLSAE